MHGTKDTDVPFEESLMMVKQCEKHGVAHVLKRIENGEHGLAAAIPNTSQTLQEHAGFVVKHLSAK